jgi:hypothetical protein
MRSGRCRRRAPGQAPGVRDRDDSQALKPLPPPQLHAGPERRRVSVLAGRSGPALPRLLSSCGRATSADAEFCYQLHKAAKMATKGHWPKPGSSTNRRMSSLRPACSPPKRLRRARHPRRSGSRPAPLSRMPRSTRNVLPGQRSRDLHERPGRTSMKHFSPCVFDSRFLPGARMTDLCGQVLFVFKVATRIYSNCIYLC